MTLSPRFALLLALVTLAACDRPSPLPDMGLSSSAVVFEAPAAAGDPQSQSVYVTNTGAGSLARPSATIAYQDGAGWLSATVTGSGAPYEIRLQATVGTLGPGAYRATVTLAAANASSSPLQVAATLDIPEPRFALSTASLDFAAPRGGGSPPPQDFLVTNGGRGLLPVPQVAISYVGAAGWLSTVVGGTPDAYSVTTVADGTGLDSGTYVATITLTAEGDAAPPRTMAVSLVIPPIEIGLSVATLAIGGTIDDSTPVPAELTASNVGGGLMPAPGYLIEPAASTWLTGVEVTGAAPPYLIRIFTSHVGLPAGLYTGTVWLGPVAKGVAAMKAVEVQLLVPLPVPLTAPRELYFYRISGCPVPAAQRVVVYGSRIGLVGPLTATVDPRHSSWVEATVTGIREPYAVTITMTGAPPVAPRTPIRVNLSAAGASATHFFVYLSVSESLPAGSYSFSPWSLQFHAQLGAGDPAPQRVRVFANGACPAAPTAAVAPADALAWLSQQVDGSDFTTFLVRPSTGGFTAGETRHATVGLGGFAYTPPPPVGPGPLPPETPVVEVSVTAASLQPGTSLLASRRGHALLAHSSGVAFAIGGIDGGGLMSAIETYSPMTGLWTETLPPLPHPRVWPGVVELAGGDILVCGGQGGTGLIGACDLYSQSFWGWLSFGDLQHGHLSPQLIELPGRKVLVLGTTWPEVLDLSTWLATPVKLPVFAMESGVLLPSGLVLMVGPSVSAALYDPTTGRSWETGRLPVLIDRPALHLLPDGRVLAVGLTSLGANAAYTWDLATGAWSTAVAPRRAHARNSTLSLANGSLLAWNGADDSTSSDELELFDPITGTWSVAGWLPQTYVDLPIAQLRNGMLVMAGGMLHQDVKDGLARPDTLTW